MPTEAEWQSLLSAVVPPDAKIYAEEIHEIKPGAAGALKAFCSDGEFYVLKAPHVQWDSRRGYMEVSNNRWCFNECLVAGLGQLLAAPIPQTRLIELRAELLSADKRLTGLTPGVVHGMQWIEGLGPKTKGSATDEPLNRPRLACLAVLYTWVGADDQQLFYELLPPSLVWSVDHGHFIPYADLPMPVGQWTAARLAAAPPVSEIDPFFLDAGLRTNELEPVFEQLERLTPQHIAAAVARPPDQWGTKIEDKVAVCAFLARRQHETLGLRGAL